ncbi:hypothetical protein T265_03516 [Opisthorchis viverrini]|uniref:Uncharacterized protein n=1 Tax=Opisthorchis viverrini TaxID=6198 RepID=A0A075AHI1_OPIVI|nr:hypothetical protein T265_03516 [Opisthorchis viverrini]KER29924.1 hypothetical protein T265_03516 [Opisthorchis viverrini]
MVIWPRRFQMMPILVTFALAVVIIFHPVISYPTSSYLADRVRQLDISPILHEEQDLSDYFPNDALLYTPREDLQPSTFQTHGQYQSSADAELSHRDWMAHMQRQSLPHLLRTNGFTLRTQRLSRLNQAVKRDDLGATFCNLGKSGTFLVWNSAANQIQALFPDQHSEFASWLRVQYHWTNHQNLHEKRSSAITGNLAGPEIWGDGWSGKCLCHSFCSVLRACEKTRYENGNHDFDREGSMWVTSPHFVKCYSNDRQEGAIQPWCSLTLGICGNLQNFTSSDDSVTEEVNSRVSKFCVREVLPPVVPNRHLRGLQKTYMSDYNVVCVLFNSLRPGHFGLRTGFSYLQLEPPGTRKFAMR